MKIAIVSQHFPPELSGNASRVFDMATKMAAAGATITVLAPHPTFPTGSFPRTWRWRKRSTVNGVNVVNLWCWQPRAKEPNFVSRMAYYLTFPLHALLWALFNPSKYDVIIGSTPPLFTSIPGYFATLIHRKKTFVVEVRDLWIDAAVSLGYVKEKSLFTRLSRRFERASHNRAKLIAVTTSDAGDKVAARSTVPKSKIVHVPNGVDTERFQRRDVPPKPQFVYAGNIGTAQDLENVLRALKIVHKTHPDARIVIAGDGETRDQLMALTKELQIGDRVSFPGLVPRDHMPILYSESAAGLAPLKPLRTLEYAVPTKAYEYLACGTPFLGTGIGEIVKLAEQSSGGIIAESTPEGISIAMKRLLDDQAAAKELGSRGRQYVVAHYDRNKIAANYLNALKKYVESSE